MNRDLESGWEIRTTLSVLRLVPRPRTGTDPGRFHGGELVIGALIESGPNPPANCRRVGLDADLYRQLAAMFSHYAKAMGPAVPIPFGLAPGPLKAVREFAEATVELLNIMGPVDKADPRWEAVAKRQTTAALRLCFWIYPKTPPGSPQAAETLSTASGPENPETPSQAPENRLGGVVWRQVGQSLHHEAWVGRLRIGEIRCDGDRVSPDGWTATAAFWRTSQRFTLRHEAAEFVERSWGLLLDGAGLTPATP